MQKPLIMIVDDDLGNIGLIGDILEKNNYEIAVATSGEQALNIIENIDPDLILMDVTMPGMSGFDLCKIFKGKEGSLNKKHSCFGKAKEIPIIFQTGKTDSDYVLKGFKVGGVDYITKPFNSAELLARINTHVDLRITRKNLQETETHLKRVESKIREDVIGISNVVAVSHQMQTAIKKAKMFHKVNDIPVLIEGETGTGKEIIARILHYGDEKEHKPFVDINSAVFPKDLFESELFGYAPGAFTGADKKGKAGYFEKATGGTLFLDEVGELPLNLQPKLLRVLQEGTYYKIGGTKKHNLDARIVTATNKNLSKCAKDESFRADLFHRLSVGYIYIPPLRERKDDIKPLAESLLAKFAMKNSLEPKKLTSSALEALLQYPWPGNVRELENTLRLADFMADSDVISREHIEFRTGLYNSDNKVVSQQQPMAGLDFDNITLPDDELDLNELNKKIVLRSLIKFENNSSRVANYLGVSRQTIYRFMKKNE